MSTVEIETQQDAQRVSDALMRSELEESHRECRDREAAFVCAAIDRVHDFYLDPEFVRRVLMRLASKAHRYNGHPELVEQIDALIDWIGEEA
jgi:hypothetical protein